MKFRHMLTPLLVGILSVGCSSGDAGTTDTTPTAAVVEASQSVIADGVVEPARSVALSFEQRGTVAAVLVKAGDTVKKGAVLAQLDSRNLELQVAQAEAVLAEAKASYDKLVAGASEQDIAAAQAQVTQAQAQQRQVAGGVTGQDIAAAQAQLTQARAALAELQAGAKATDLQTAQANVDQAQATLQTQRDSLSLAKTSAQSQMEQAVAALTQAQSRYSTALQNWQFAQQTGNNPSQPSVPDAQGNEVDNQLDGTQAQQYYDAYVQAEAGLRSAEEGVAQAQAAYDTARQNEVAGINAAEAQVRATQAGLQKLHNGASKDQLAAARAQVQVAQANLAKLQGEQRGGSLAAAAAGIAAAEANLARLTADPQSSDLAIAQARVQQADVALQQARLALDKAALKAPFDATLVEINLKEGEVPDTSIASAVLADFSAWEIKTEDLTELDIVRVREGAPATITFDALPGLELPGAVKWIEAIGKNKDGDITYAVTVAPQRWDDRLRWKMTASVAITPP